MDTLGLRASPAGSDPLAVAARSVCLDFAPRLALLVAIPSSTYDPAGIARLAEAVATPLAALGAATEMRIDGDPARTGPTLVAHLTGPRPGPRIVVLGHLDTVAALDDPPPILRIDGGRAYGVGAADMKGGLLGLVDALRILKVVTGHAVPAGELVVIAGPDEEIGSPVGSVAIRALLPGAAAALVLEPARPNGDLVIARKGMVQARIQARGRAAHAGVEPERGRSAILTLAHAAIALHAIDEASGGIPGVSCSVGTIAGGTRPNVVPADATLAFDLRAPTAAALAAAEARIDAIIRAPAVPGVELHLLPEGRFPPMEGTPGSLRLLALAESVAAAQGFRITAQATGGASDANLVAGLGVPVLDGLGPIGAGMHGPDESIDLASVPERVALLAGMLASLLAGTGGLDAA